MEKARQQAVGFRSWFLHFADDLASNLQNDFQQSASQPRTLGRTGSGSGRKSLETARTRTNQAPATVLGNPSRRIGQPNLNNFNFAGICNRYLDSNGYSLRSSGEDVAHSFRLRIKQSRDHLELKALDPARSVPITVASAILPQRNRDAFVKLNLEPGWKLERRIYQGRKLSHVYFAHPDPVNLLIAKASAHQGPSVFNQLGASKAPLPPPISIANNSVIYGKGPIRLVVIPYRP